MRTDFGSKERQSYGLDTVALSLFAFVAAFALWFSAQTKEIAHGRTSHRPCRFRIA
jgi:hypothetical protein